jgi:hypothetical protein
VLYVPRTTTLTGIAVHRVAGSSVSATGRLGLWAAGSNGLPTTLVHDAGTVDISTTGVKSVTGLSVALAPGWYWASLNAGTFTGTLGWRSVELEEASVENDPIGRGLFGDASPGTTTPLYTVQGVLVGTGGLPGTFPTPGVSGEGPTVWIQTSGT